MLVDALDHLVRGIVDHPDDVSVRSREARGAGGRDRDRGSRPGGRGETLEVRVNPEDLGRVIGRSGRTATALRTVLQALSGQEQHPGRLRRCRPPALTTPGPTPGAGRRRRARLRPLTPTRTSIEITVGRIGRAHGLRGDVFLDVRTDEPERRFASGSRFSTRRGVLVLESARWHGARLVARFEQASDREGAELLRGIELRVDVPADERPEDPEEFYDHQLRGLAAHLDTGERIGRVNDVLHLPGQDMLVLDIDASEVLVPFVAEIVTSVDLEAGRVEIADLPGLLSELPSPDEGTEA